MRYHGNGGLNVVATRKIVGSFITEDQEYQRLQGEDFKEAASRAGFDSEVVYADGTAVFQVRQLFKFIHLPEEERPSALLVETVASDGLAHVASSAVRAGIGWVQINASLPHLAELRIKNPHLPISAVTTDQLEIGRIQALQFNALLPDGGHLLYLQGPSGNPAAEDRLKGMREGIGASSIEVTVLKADWTEGGGEKAVESWLRLMKIKQHGFEDIALDLVGCQNDSLAAGARRALSTQRPDWAGLPYTGCDGLPGGGQKMVAAGHLSATIVNPSNAGPAVDLIARFVDHKKPTPEIEVLSPKSFPPIDEL